ncbi:MAG: C39 family peptidase [Aquisalimonadaceae bacterium]
MRVGWLVLATLCLLPGIGLAGTVWTPGGSHAVPVVSLKEARFHAVIRQQYDYSCGAAALATLLTYHYDDVVAEATVFDSMLTQANRAVVEQQGFSMLDMKNFLEARGYPADGFRADLDALAENGIPAIALINVNGYRHFVVVKGVTDDEVLIGDPALGVRVYGRSTFQEIWNGLLFVILDKANIAGKSFNDAATWRVRTRAPFGLALQQPGLSGFTLSLPRSGDY